MQTEPEEDSHWEFLEELGGTAGEIRKKDAEFRKRIREALEANPDDKRKPEEDDDTSEPES